MRSCTAGMRALPADGYTLVANSYRLSDLQARRLCGKMNSFREQIAEPRAHEPSARRRAFLREG